MTDDFADLKRIGYTEAEAIQVGDRTHRRKRLIALSKSCLQPGSALSLKLGPAVLENVPLSNADVNAILSLLTDRETAWLVAMNVDVAP